MKGFFNYWKANRNHVILIFSITFITYIFMGLCISNHGMFDREDIFFGSDNARAFADMTNILSDHYRIKVHPMFLLIAETFTLFINGFVNRLSMAVILEEALCGALSVSFFYSILKMKEVEKEIRLIFTIIYGFSFSIIIFSAVPETFIFACLGLISYWYVILLLSNYERAISRKEYFLLIFWGMISFGITLTNYVSYIVGLGYLLLCRSDLKTAIKRFVKINIANVFFVVALCKIQQFIWKGCPLFWSSIFEGMTQGEYEEFRYMNWEFNLQKTYSWFKQIFCYPYLSPKIVLLDEYKIRFSEYPGGIKIILVLFLLVFIVCIAAEAVKVMKKFKNIQDLYILPLMVSLGGNVVLHYIYGSNEAFMYTPHFSFLFLIVAALSLNQMKESIYKKIVRNSAILFALIEGINNIFRFFQTAKCALYIVNTPFSLIHSIKGAILCGMILLAVYMLWTYSKWKKAELSSNMESSVAKVNCIYKCIIFYLIIVGIVGLFIAFNY